MWFVRFVTSSIGKKIVMATSGLLLFFFLITHAAGNSTIFMSSEAFQNYADTLHSFPLLVNVFSTGLFLIFIIHIGTGLYLFNENRKMLFSRYVVTTRVVKNSFASKTMAYTGLFLLVFLVIHIFGFSFSPKTIPISVTVRDLLGNFFYSLLYLVAFIALAIHLSHGFWSMLQTFGVNHPRYSGIITILTYTFPVIFLAIFGGIALYFMTGLGASY